ncbi:MAG TPA: Ig-like domain-containing protein [Kofleriaceae bacterium]|nr:Ig-like domain-containing protein [Kofleriaceae bacterium]
MCRTSCTRWALVAALMAGGCGGDDDGGSDGGGGPGPDASPGPLTLIGRTPDRGAENVWVHDPIVLQFSHALDPDTVPGSVQVNTAGDPVPFELELSADRTSLIATVTEPLATPAEVTISVAESLRDERGEGFAGDIWFYILPVWQRIAPQAGERPALAIDATGAMLAAWISDGAAAVYRLEAGEWRQLGGAIGDAVTGVRLAVAGDAPVLAWSQGGEGSLHRFDGDDWVELGSALPGPGGAALDLAVDPDGRPVTAGLDGAGVSVQAWNGDGFTALGPPLAVGDGTTEIALAMDGAAPVIASVTGDSLTVSRLDGDTWAALGGGPAAESGASSADVAAQGGEVAVAWRAQEGAGGHVLAARTGKKASAWQRVASAADLDLQDEAGEPAIAIAADGAVHLAWAERTADGERVLAARAAPGASSWEFLDSAAGRADSAGQPALALDSRGVPSLVWVEAGGVAAARWNDSPALRHGLVERLPAAGCAIPAEGPPAALSETGCYADVAAHRVAAQLVPFAVNSPLWSDGALKRRYLLVPDGEVLGATAQGAWQVPVGSILIKEFWLESAGEDPPRRFPVETRLMVKRCEEGDCPAPWEGYGYQWNPEGTEALLLAGDDEVRVGWQITDEQGQQITHDHIYPARSQCLRCHNAAAGRVLGLQTAQLDRPGEFGEVIDNQLRAMANIGLIDDTGAGARLPSPQDPSYSLEQRSRAYFHANCSHCHQPGSENNAIDFRFQAPLEAGNICDRLTPGDHTSSTIYIRDSTRGAGQMPPLATDLVDADQLAVTQSWINQMTSCP